MSSTIYKEMKIQDWGVHGDGTSETSQTHNVLGDRERCQLQDLRYEAYCDLALWSHPAWLQAYPYSLHNTAVMQWVAYHRTWMASQKITVSEIIGGVQGIIPQSNLAKYGNYKYDVDFEDMYIRAGVNENECEQVSNKSHSNPVYKDYDNYLGVSAADADAVDQLYKTVTRKTTLWTKSSKNTFLNDWLKKIKEILMAVKRIANFYNVYHSKTDGLAKSCLKFIADAQHNPDVIKLMESDMPFFVAYEELLREHVSKIELHSIPQPPLKEHIISQNIKQEDEYWLKLASLDVRKHWEGNTRAVYPHEIEYVFLSEQYSLIWINFLRRKRESSDMAAADIEVPESKGKELLGSLLNILDESSGSETATTGRGAGDFQASTFGARMSFPQAHGDCTDRLFLRRPGQPLTGKPPSVSNPLMGMQTKPENSNSPVLRMPLRYYQTVPHLQIAPITVVPPVRSPYATCQSWRLSCLSQNGVLNCRPQPRQFIVPRISARCMPFATSAPPISLPSPSWENTLSQRETFQELLNHQFFRLNAPRITYERKLPKMPRATVNDSISEIPLPTDDATSQTHSESEKTASEGKLESTVQKSDTSSSSTEILASFNLRNQRLGVVNSSLRKVSTVKEHASSVSNAASVPPNLQHPERKVKTLIVAHRPLIPQQNPNDFYQRFLGPSTLSTLQYYDGNRQICASNNALQNHLTVLTNLLSHQDRSVSYKDKVEKWLEGNKKYMITSPLYDFEKTPSSVPAENGKCSNLYKSCVRLSDSHQRKRSQVQNFKRMFLSYYSLTNLKKGNSLDGKIKFLEKLIAEAKISSHPMAGSNRRVRKGSMKHPASVKSSTRKENNIQIERYLSNSSFRRTDSAEFITTSTPCQNYRVLAVENFEYNSFPSKRVKRSNDVRLGHCDGYNSIKEMNKMIAELDYYNTTVDEIIFAEETVNRTLNGFRRMKVSGWDSFQLAVKSVLKNLTILIKNQHAQDIQHKLIKL